MSSDVPQPPVADRRLERLHNLGRWLDSSIRLPGINYRIGYDAVIGLIPGVGDLIGLGLSLYIVLEASRLGVAKSTLVRMLTNVGVEAVVGAVPFFGDIFDATWKANARNLKLLDAQIVGGRGELKWSNRRFLGTIIGIVLVLLIGVIVLAVLAVQAIVALLGG